MLSKNIKRLILIIIDLVFSGFIWYVNASWGNSFLTCLILSTTTFLIIYTPFEIYWSFRDLWFERWNQLKIANLSKKKIKIPVRGGYIGAELIENQLIQTSKKIKGVVIINHGFSDTKEDLYYVSDALAKYGYIVLTYDARGVGDSKKLGHRSEFQQKIDDFHNIIKWIKKTDKISSLPIYCIAFSIGATVAIAGSFLDNSVDKIIAISAISKYKSIFKRINPLLLLLYILKGVTIFPTEQQNLLLSPYYIFEQKKKSVSQKRWNQFSKKILLIHTRNDKVIKLQNFNENREVLDLPPQNQIILNKGGHSQKKNELCLLGATIRFLES